MNLVKYIEKYPELLMLSVKQLLVLEKCDFENTKNKNKLISQILTRY